MLSIRTLHEDDIQECARIYAHAYREEPWNEKYRREQICHYLICYLHSSTKCAYSLVHDGRIIGIALGLIVPSIDSPYFRLEDICIDPTHQRKGYGREFLRLLSEVLTESECDSILLGTQAGYPSHHLYLQCGFQEIDSVLLYRPL